MRIAPPCTGHRRSGARYTALSTRAHTTYRRQLRFGFLQTEIRTHFRSDEQAPLICLNLDLNTHWECPDSPSRRGLAVALDGFQDHEHHGPWVEDDIKRCRPNDHAFDDRVVSDRLDDVDAGDHPAAPAIVEEDRVSDAEVASYAREVLSRDRRVEAAAPETGGTTKLNWYVVGAQVAVVLAIIAFVTAW